MKKFMFLFMVMGLMMVSCSNDSDIIEEEIIEYPVSGPSYMTIYRMNGNYANNVSILLDPVTRSFPIAFPDVTWSGRSSTILELHNGFYYGGWADATEGTAFLKWTYDEYRALDRHPTDEELMAAVIKEARVLESYRVPYIYGTNEEKIDRLNALIDAGFPESECTLVYKAE